jgi:type I site-specific restriction-modification system R (restriction) subunit
MSSPCSRRTPASPKKAKFGTLTTHTEKYFYRWADSFPLTLEDLDHGSSSPNDQQRLVAGMLSKDNLLEIIRNFTLFSANDKGETIKIVGRYQQFRAVKKAVHRLLEGKTPRERSGIIWHTQGSGRSLTMMFMVRTMYRHPNLSQWKVVFVTDRTQLEQQLAETGQNVGFTVKPADSIAKLKELLRSDSSDLVMAMIHKFQERDLQETFPELNRSANILVMTDEAHRSQYALLGANLDKALPYASRIGYTGTPIDKTEKVFGDYIDKYTMRQAIEDGVTLEIVYEGRTHNAEVPDQTDRAFEDVFSDYNLQERMQILGYGSRDAYLEAHPTLAAKAQDIVKHSFDAEDQSVTGETGIVIVNNMLLTGFDAPVEQVMYLDKVIQAHNLLQAIARMNRVGGVDKDKGFVVDYVGIGHHLRRAIDTYDELEQKEVEETLSFPEEEIRQLEDDHRTILALLEKFGLTDLTDHDAFYDLFYDEDIRFEFMLAFKKLTRSLNLAFPAREALKYMPDYQALAELNVLAGKHFRDPRMSMKGIPAKLRALADAYLSSKGIDEKVKPISILDDDFESQVAKRKRTKTKAAEVEHALRHHIDISKYRWGSCTPNDNVTFNWRLVKAPMFVIDYVVVHELAHLIEPNHTPRTFQEQTDSFN